MITASRKQIAKSASVAFPDSPKRRKRFTDVSSTWWRSARSDCNFELNDLSGATEGERLVGRTAVPLVSPVARQRCARAYCG